MDDMKRIIREEKISRPLILPNIFVQFILFFKSSWGQCGIQFPFPTSSDNLCLLFCLIIILYAWWSVGRHAVGQSSSIFISPIDPTKFPTPTEHEQMLSKPLQLKKEFRYISEIEIYNCCFKIIKNILAHYC